MKETSKYDNEYIKILFTDSFLQFCGIKMYIKIKIFSQSHPFSKIFLVSKKNRSFFKTEKYFLQKEKKVKTPMNYKINIPKLLHPAFRASQHSSMILL